jgi:predicted HTH transcriptional regulator
LGDNRVNCRLLEGLSIRLSKGLSKGLSETAANIYKMIYADNYITRSDIANRIGISVTAVQKHINKLKSLRFIDRDGSTGHGNWRVIK